jgi:Ca2+-binding EF-hand superfamily protein
VLNLSDSFKSESIKDSRAAVSRESKRCFETYCDVGHDAVSLENLGVALVKLNVEVESQEWLARYFDEIDMDQNQTLDFTEFRRILNKKSAIQEWASTLSPGEDR